MAFDFSTLITDRAQSDLDTLRDLLATPMADWTAEQLAAFNRAASKGAYNYTDLNRVIAAMDDLNERLTAAGYETGYRRIVVHEQVPDPDPYRYLRMQINAVRSGSQVQLSEIRLMDRDGNSYQWPSGTQVTTSLNYRTGEGPDNLIDGNPATKLYSGSFTPGSTITIDLGAANTVDVAQYTQWQWYTANDMPNRDPVSFDLQISNDGSAWETADSVTGADITELRESLAYTGQITANPPAEGLPDGYTQLEYIESTGTQYINTGLNPTQDFAISLRALTSQTGSYTMVGSDISWTGNGFSIGVSFAHYGSQTLDPINVYNDGNEHEITLTNNVLASDGVNIHTFGLQTFSINYPIFLFANNRAGSPREHTTMRLWSAKIMAGETDLMVLVPCKNPSGDVGLYDLENHQFYGNSGTGVFTSGPESPQPEPEPTLAPYIWYEADVPTVSLMDEYLANVAALRAVLNLPETTPEVPADMDRLTQAEANAIEAVLDIINTYLLALQSIFRRCGAVVCGGPELYFV